MKNSAPAPRPPQTETAPGSDAQYADWREAVLNRVLPLALIAGLPALLNAALQSDFQVPSQVAGVALYVVLYTCLAVITFFPRLGSTWRSWGFMFVLYLTALVSFLRAGIIGDGLIYLFDATILALKLIDQRAGLFIGGLSLATYAGLTVISQTGTLSVWAVYGQNPWDLRYWVANGITLAVSLGVVAYVLARSTAFNLASLQRAQQAAAKLAEANRQLDEINQRQEQVIAQRTQELRESLQNLKDLAMYDNLTGLPNRLLLYDRLRQAILVCQRDQARFAVLFVDLDDFKEVNDTYGHDIGDQFLVTVAWLFKGIVRESDTIARLGGDEFVLILRDAQSARSVERVAGEIVQSFSQPILVGDLSIRVSVSIGIGLFPDHATEPETLIQKADAAMYAVKRAAKNSYRFSE